MADLRAPTPSAAAELAVPDIYEIEQKIITYQNRLRQSLLKKLEIMHLKYEKLMSSFAFKEPTRRIQENYILIDNQIKKLENLINLKIEKQKTKYTKLVAKLDAYSPLKTLARGYTITKKDGKVLKSKSQLKSGDIVEIVFSDGQKDAVIKEEK